jgi:hypothetical protein
LANFSENKVTLDDFKDVNYIVGFFVNKNLAFKPTNKFEVDISSMNREDKIEQMNSFAKHDHYQVSFEGEFIHLADKFSVKKGEWQNVESKGF